MSRSHVAAGFAAALVLGICAAVARAAEPLPGSADWPLDGTYEGSWTVVDIVYDGPGMAAPYDVGDSVGGSIAISCADRQAVGCQFSSTYWDATLTPDPQGGFSSVEEQALDDGGSASRCDGEPTVVNRTEIAGVFEGHGAVIGVSDLFLPRTYTDGQGCSWWHADQVWRFEGALATGLPSPSPGGHGTDLRTYLTDYGFDCTTGAGDDTTCLMELADATYRVVTTADTSGEVSGVDASVTSLDESMPSDAGGFLRGVAQRAPVADADGLVSWFDGAIAGGDPEYAEGPWSATWSDTQSGDGLIWALRLVRAGDALPEPPRASDEPPPVAPREQPGPAGPVDPRAGSDGERRAEPFAASVPEPSEVSTDPSVLLQSALLAALLVFLMPFPSQLFNSTLESHEDEVRRWLRLDRLGAAARGLGEFWATWPGVILFTCVAATLYGFLDPGFGLDAGSLATFLGMLAGIVLVTAAFAIPTVLAHRRLGDRPSLTVVPVSLLIGVLCVLVSRLTDFQPGYLYGLLIGLAFARELSAADEGRATAVGAALMLGVAFLAWLALGALPDDEGFGLVVARTALAALMVAGLEGVVFGLLPMRFLPGESVYSWNRPLWGALLLAGAFAFFHILINPASGYLADTSRTPLLTVIALLLGFSLVSVAFWAWFRFRPESARPIGPGEEGAA